MEYFGGQNLTRSTENLSQLWDHAKFRSIRREETLVAILNNKQSPAAKVHHTECTQSEITWCLLLTATHSLRSSPSGSMTAMRRFPLPSVASACFSNSYWCEPSGIFFFGLNVFDERLPLGDETKVEIKVRTTYIWPNSLKQLPSILILGGQAPTVQCFTRVNFIFKEFDTTVTVMLLNFTLGLKILP